MRLVGSDSGGERGDREGRLVADEVGRPQRRGTVVEGHRARRCSRARRAHSDGRCESHLLAVHRWIVVDRQRRRRACLVHGFTDGWRRAGGEITIPEVLGSEALGSDSGRERGDREGRLAADEVGRPQRSGAVIEGHRARRCSLRPACSLRWSL